MCEVASLPPDIEVMLSPDYCGSREIATLFCLALLLLTSAAGADDADESPRILFNAVAIGALGRNDPGIGMLEARATLSPHLIVTAVPAIVSAAAVSELD